jgi:hypothetical protein
MCAADGDDLGEYESVVPNCSLGDTLYVAGKPAYRISAVIPMDDLDNGVYDGIWEVVQLTD